MNNKKKRVKKIIGALCCVIAAVIFISRVVYVNLYFTGPEKTIYNAGTMVDFKGVQLAAQSYEIVDYSDDIKKINICLFINDTEGAGVDLSSAVVYADGFVNGMNYNGVQNVNQIGVSNHECIISFNIPQSLLSDSMWKNVNNLHYKLVLSDLSQIYVLNLG